MTGTPGVIWNEVALEAIRARALFLLHAAMFHAWAAYDRTAVGQHWQAQTRRPLAEHSEARQRVAMAYAACRVLADLFPLCGVGNLAPAESPADRHDDGSNQRRGYADTGGHAPVNTPERITDGGRRQPLRVGGGHGGVGVQRFITTHWGRVTPFALTCPDQFPPAGARRNSWSRCVRCSRTPGRSLAEARRLLGGRPQPCACSSP